MPQNGQGTLAALVGGTPLIELNGLSPHPGVRLFAKLEGQNPSGSVKDRIAIAMLDAAELRGAIQPGATLVEASTGNTAIALAALAPRRGYRVRVVLPKGIVPSVADILDLYGAEIEWCEPEAGMRGAIGRVQELARQPGYYAVGQFSDPANVLCHYATTGEEIVRAMGETAVDVFVAGIGTGGTITGVARRLREQWPDVQVVGVEPRLGERLQGLRSLSEGYIPPLLDLGMLDRRFLVDSASAIAAAREVMRAEGVFAGVSSGAALHTALRVAEGMERGNIVMMFSDGAWKYLPSRPWDATGADAEALDEVHWW
ncbi:MAG: cysteine synthase family protein [Chloroflexota bacterium]|nr:cysteine synthase family protein [Chloroflexota bacterium]MDE2886283.1 cysteine synthase family protein [Chloroflexota bacterium]